MPYDLPLMKRGAEIEVLIDRLDRKGRGTGSVDGRTMAVRGGLPGQVVRVRVTRRRRLEGYVLEVVTRSPHEVDARCPHSGSCGGCAFQQLAYPVQLTALREQVGNAFAAAGLEVVVPVKFNRSEIPAILWTKARWIEKTLAQTRPAKELKRPESITFGLLDENWKAEYSPSSYLYL